MTPDDLAAIRAAHVESIGDDLCAECGVRWPCDAAQAIAEVNRLMADLADTAAYAALGRENERARIRAEVKSLPVLHPWSNPNEPAYVRLDTVLAVISGEIE